MGQFNWCTFELQQFLLSWWKHWILLTRPLHDLITFHHFRWEVIKLSLSSVTLFAKMTGDIAFCDKLHHSNYQSGSKGFWPRVDCVFLTLSLSDFHTPWCTHTVLEHKITGRDLKFLYPKMDLLSWITSFALTEVLKENTVIDECNSDSLTNFAWQFFLQYH